MVAFQVEFTFSLALGVFHMITCIATCFIIEWTPSDMYVYHVAVATSLGLFACHTAETSFLNLSNVYHKISLWL